MKKTFFTGLSSLLLPLGLYGVPTQAVVGYQRSYLSAGMSTASTHGSIDVLARAREVITHETMASDELDIVSAVPVNELVVIDAAVPDKHALYRNIKPGLEIVELDANTTGLTQLTNILQRYKNLSALHIISHAEDGILLLGSSRVDAQVLQREVDIFNALNGALADGADLLFYGCNLAKGEAGEDFLSIFQANTKLDLAASDDLTGASVLDGDWDLEIRAGHIETQQPFSDDALKDFVSVLQLDQTITMDGFELGYGEPKTATYGAYTARLSLDDGDPTEDSMNCINGYGYGPQCIVDYSGGSTGDKKFYFDFTGGEKFDVTSLYLYTAFYVDQNLRISSDKGDTTDANVLGDGTGDTIVLNWTGITRITIEKVNGSDIDFLRIDDIVLANIGPALDSDATLTAAGGVTEPVGLATTIDTVGEAEDVLDFTITDGGGGDGLATTVSQIVVNVSGTSSDAERGQITWRLNGPDVINVTGTYNPGSDTIIFSGLSISVADGGNETYTVNAYFNNNTGLTEDRTIILSVDGDTNLAVGGAGTQMAGGQSAVTNGTGTTIDIVASQLVFTTQPAGSVSGVALTTQPVVAARDAFGNTDVDFSETITLAQASAGSLSNNTQAAAAGVATFTGLTYTATADQQAFTLTANDQDAVDSNLAPVDANSVTSDVVATQLVFDTQPAPLVVQNGQASSLSTVPAVSARDASNLVDTGYSTAITLTEVNGAGSATLSATDDTDGDNATVSVNPGSGVATFTGMQLTYTAAGSSNETFNLRASSAGLTVADSSSFTATVPPSVTSVDVPVSGTYKTGDTLTFTVNTSENVTVSGTPRIAITVGSDTVYAEYFGGSGTSDLVFTYTITAGDLDSNGIALASVIEANGGTLQDGDANDLILTLNAVGSTAAVLVDAVAPTISSVSVPAADTYLVGETLSFTVNTTENVTVSTGGGTPHLPLTIGATAREAVYVSGSTTSALVFSYTVQAGDNDGDGIAIGASAVLDGGTMRDAAGNDLTLTLNAVGDASGVLVDTAAPTLQTLSPADDSATVAASANFVMTFSEDITLGAGDITLYDSLNAQVAVIDVASHGGQLSITGNELTINPTADLSESTSYYIHVDNGAVTDLAGIAYAGIADSTSWNFTVADVTPPTVTSITVAGSPSASAEAIQFTVTFDEVPANISVSDFTLTPSGAGVSGNIASNSPVNLNTVTVTVDQITGTGTLRLDVNASSGITDTLGNGNGTNGFVPAFTSGDLHTVDREAPGVPTGLSLDAASDSGTPGDAVTNDNTPTINGTADANVTVEVSSDVDGVLGTTTSDGSGAWSFTPGAAMTDGAHNLTATAADTAGNESAASSALAIEVDTAAPTAGIDMADTTLVAGETSSVTITFSEAILGFTNDDLTLANGTLTNVSSSDGNVTWTATFTPAADTTSAVNLISLDLTGVTDVAGNAGAGTENSANYTIDTLRPSATVVIADTELLAGETSLVTMTFNEAVSGFSNADLTVVNGSLDAVASTDGGVTWTATFTPDPDIYELDNLISLDNTGVVDAAGNTGSGTTFSNEFTVRTQALTLLVTSNLDTGDDGTTAATLIDDEADGNGLSLREALFWARSNGDTITFDLDGGTAGNQGGTITLNGSELAVSHNNLIIDGDLDDDGTPDITLSGNNVSRIMRVASGRTGIELVGLTLTQGAGNGGGGGLALDINTDTTLRDSTITDNHELGFGGGGIYGSTATLRIFNSTISANSSDSFGGGIRLVGNGVLHLINSTVSNNTTTGTGGHGGGVQYAGPDLLIVNSTITGNAAMGSSAVGGGLRVSSGTAAIYNATIVGNVAGSSAGGVSANGTNDVFVNTVVAGNAAGAGAMAGASGSPLA
ncbi:MAG TPA: Ig-like domain-containing protein, partial [Cellvibrio sp.]|nr:Ig-like domain-containing protein [Cellvibrio sp.]